jgi:hypothetical protein
MKWITTPNVHFDRVASAWVIKRFIDPDAEFLFEAKGEESKRPVDATPFSIPGAKLGPHDENGPTFAKVVREYKLTDPAIDMIVKVVEDGIGYFMNDYRPKPDGTPTHFSSESHRVKLHVLICRWPRGCETS